ncbi:MAG: hypothetical protein F4Z00_00185 [Acidimicrobiaceae bacterium]|nr:hypothetical protein [Acidimicrobiaceae bacterium]MXZ63960.1 hypothetical protein [Acidimicrobiaceae bacterium]MYF31977.1 hypothetical protein [Acidimicrobiaceae bacterium]MYG76951.1 hypothetical protein [Acidimicrobiaceae bacterium]MYJ84418.1 hypothetical protein [Acidimicrobiaceae bacterium]
MHDGQASTDGAEVWGQILFEARELRNKQDARLATAQRQSQLLVAGFLAITALVLTAISVYVASQPEAGIESRLTEWLSSTDYAIFLVTSVFGLVALFNGYVWVITNVSARRRTETLDINKLMDFYSSSTALPHLRRHLARTLIAQHDKNERPVKKAQSLVLFQAMTTFTFFYALFAAVLIFGRPT